MDRKNFWYKQLVTEAQMDAAFDDVEAAINRAVAEWVLYGIISGGSVTAQAVPDDTVNIAGPFYGYSPQGERLHQASSSTLLDCSVDRDGVSTTPAVGKERYVIVLAGFDRTLSDPHLDGHGITVYWQSSEAVVWEVVQGAEATPGNAVPPAIPSDRLCLAVVLLQNPAGVVEIENADIFAAVGAVKRSDWLYYASSGYVTSAQQFGTPKAAATALFDRFANLAANQMTKATPPGWCDAAPWTTGPGTTVHSVMDAIVTSLASKVAVPGADRIGSTAFNPLLDGTVIGAKGVHSQMDEILQAIGTKGDAVNASHAYAPGGAYSLPGGSVRTALRALLDDLNDHVANGGGNHTATAIVFTPGASWYGAAKTLASVNVQTAINEVLSDLTTVTNAALNGANYIGAFGQAGTPTALVTGSIYSQLGTLLAAVNDRVSKSAGAEQEMLTGIKPTVSGASGLGTALLPWGDGHINNLYLVSGGTIAPRTGTDLITPYTQDPNTDNSKDLGTATHGYRRVYFATDVRATTALGRMRVLHPWTAQFKADSTHAVPEPWVRGIHGVSGMPLIANVDVTYPLHIPLSPVLLGGETLKSIQLCLDRGGGTVTWNLYRQQHWDDAPGAAVATGTITTGTGRTTYNLAPSEVIADDEMWYIELTTDTALLTLYYGARIGVEFNSIVR